MLLVMIIFAVMSAGFFYASRVPAVQDEVSVMMGTEGSGEDVGRLAHIVFIMFTFTSPLLLAGALSSALSVIRWLDRRR